jgi:single-strand DNA-binding protein
MSSLNKVFLIGRLGHDPKILSDKEGVPYAAEVSLATSTKWTDKTSGEKKEDTEWHKVIFYNKLAETVREYLKKGSMIYVEGRIKSHKYNGKDGVERTGYQIIAQAMTMLSGKKDNEHIDHSKQMPLETDFVDDKIPF